MRADQGMRMTAHVRNTGELWEVTWRWAEEAEDPRDLVHPGGGTEPEFHGDMSVQS